MLNKKGIHPVVSVALLLVVAVVAVVGFNSWFNTFETGVLTGIEQDTNKQIPSDIYVEDLTTQKIFLKSHSGSSTISNVEIYNQNKTKICDLILNLNVPKGLSTINVSSCSLIKNGVYEIILTANNQLIEHIKIVQ